VTRHRPRPSVTRPVRHRRRRNAAIVAGVAALIAAGGYGAVEFFRPDAQPPQSVPAQRSPATVTRVQALRELDQSIAGRYGNRPAADAAVNPSDKALRELDQSIAGQYGPQSAVTPSDKSLRELDQSIAGQYGPTR
jgi:hypothetical protein